MPVSQFCLLSGALKFQLYVALSLSAHKLLFTISHRHSRVRQLNCHAIIFTAVARLGRRGYSGRNLKQDFTFAPLLQESYYTNYSINCSLRPIPGLHFPGGWGVPRLLPVTPLQSDWTYPSRRRRLPTWESAGSRPPRLVAPPRNGGCRPAPSPTRWRASPRFGSTPGRCRLRSLGTAPCLCPGSSARSGT